MPLSRRRFLGWLAGATAAAGVGIAALDHRGLGRRLLAPLGSASSGAAPAPLSASTRAALAGFLEAYLPPSAASANAIAATVEEADQRARTRKGFARTMAEGLQMLGGEAGAGLFARSGLAARREALRRRFGPARPAHYLTASGRAYLRFRHEVLPELVEDFFAGEAGWRVVGYRTFPGKCGEPRAYTRPPV